MKIETEKSLNNQSTMACPSVAEYFSAPESISELTEYLAWAESEALDVHVLGGGSNVILPRKIKGIVICPRLMGFEVFEQDEQSVCVELGAGESWHHCVERCVNLGYSGIENLALIPGSCGAAPMQNIGAYGVEISQVFDSLSAIDIKSGKPETFSREACEFSYRDSVFKSRLRKKYVITSIRLRLDKVFSGKIEYPALREMLHSSEQENASNTITAKGVMRAVVNIRRSKLPDPDQIPNSGSFFKNPIVKKVEFERLNKKYAGMPFFLVDASKVKIPAAWLIDQLGWKGKEYEGVVVHPKHALVITNPNRCSAENIISVSNAIRSEVLKVFDIQLEMEPQLLEGLA
ncbi:MAG: UDP-N-acetylmuramate dehydrogenase [Agarilytica sp.]